MKRRSAWTGILLIFAIGAGLLIVQRQYIRKHLPLLQAEFAAADPAGEPIFEKIGTPPDSTPHDEGEKTYATGGRKSMWQGTNTGATWQQSFEMPGQFERIIAWYRERLLADGWAPFDDPVPSTVQREFKRGKWILTIGNRAAYERPPRTRVSLHLTWNYWHRQD